MALTCHLSTLEDDIIDHLRGKFPKEVVKTVTQHEGDFDAHAIQHYSRAANALILVANGGKSERYGGLVNEVHTYDLFILTRSTSARKRNRASRLILEHVLKVVHDTDAWTTDECIKQPCNVQSKNLFGPKIDEMGLALWVVRWEQLVQIPYLEDTSSLDDFATMYIDYLRVGETDPTNTIAEQHISLPTE